MPQVTAYARTVTIPLADLAPFPGNPKRGDVATILESLCRNGQYRGLVVRETEPGTLIVLAGNHTLQALAEHGPGPCGVTITVADEELPCAVCQGQDWEPVARCEVITCDDAAARRINLVDNKAADNGTYDDDELAAALADVGDDLGGTGYTDTDLSDLLAAIEEAAEEDEDTYEDDAQQGGQEQAAASSSGSVLEGVAPVATVPPATDQPPVPAGHVQMVLNYVPEDRDEAARLVSAAREVIPAAGAPEIVLRALRALAAVLDCRHTHDQVVTVAALLKAAGVDDA